MSGAGQCLGIAILHFEVYAYMHIMVARIMFLEMFSRTWLYLRLGSDSPDDSLGGQSLLTVHLHEGLDEGEGVKCHG